MDIQEFKKIVTNKIEANDLAEQVRLQIKETAWEKQNKREGFSETFKPLISQFENPDDPKTKNIFTQNQEMLQNQFALTEGIKENQKAITQGFSQLERLADMRELPQIENFDDDQEQSHTGQSKKSPAIYDIEKNVDKLDMEYLNQSDYPRPNDFLDIDPKRLKEVYDDVIGDKKIIGNKIGGLKRTKKRTQEQEEELFNYIHHNMIFKKNIKTYLKFILVQVI